MDRKHLFLLGVTIALHFFPMPAAQALEVEGLSHETIPGYQALSLSAANVAGFIDRLRKERDELSRILEKKYEGNPEKIAGNTALWAYDRLLSAALPIGEEVKDGEGSAELRNDFLQLQRIHYGVLSDLGKRPRGFALISATLLSLLKSAAHVVGGPLLLQIPKAYLPDRPVGSWGARAEADNLHDQKGNGPLSRDQLAKLTHLEISRLSPPAGNPILDPVAPGNLFGKKLDGIQQAIRAVGQKYARFDFAHARRIVFMDEVKAEATSPKITVKDRFGLRWKVKWGDEVHTDVAAGRLYLDLGARYTDPKFYVGPGETILILRSSRKADDDAFRTFAQLRQGVYEAFFKFRLEDWILPEPLLKDASGNILGNGIVDAALAEREDIDRAFIGAYYVKFKECQMSLYDPACKRLGGTSLSGLGAARERIQRGMMLFDIWVNNIDSKDDNTRLAFLFNPESKDFDRYVEFRSDLGATFGRLVGIGRPNFFLERWLTETPFGIHFLFRPMFVPRPWAACTWADARWMALRICSLSREDIAEALAESGWPGFIRQVMVEKLIARRNQLVPVFHLDADGIREIPCDPRLTIVKGETLVKDGKLNRNSAAVKKLVSDFHPEGFAGIQIRIFN